MFETCFKISALIFPEKEVLSEDFKKKQGIHCCRIICKYGNLHGLRTTKECKRERLAYKET